MSWLRRDKMPDVLLAAMAPEERILLSVRDTEGVLLAATRLALHLVAGEQHTRWGWELVSKATLSAGTLGLVVAAPVPEQVDGLQVTMDGPARSFRLERPHRLTDVVHQRVRRSVAASRYLERPGGGGWVALRRVPGRDGLQRQLRLDAGVSWPDPELSAAATRLAAELSGRPEALPGGEGH